MYIWDIPKHKESLGVGCHIYVTALKDILVQAASPKLCRYDITGYQEMFGLANAFAKK